MKRPLNELSRESSDRIFRQLSIDTGTYLYDLTTRMKLEAQ